MFITDPPITPILLLLALFEDPDLNPKLEIWYRQKMKETPQLSQTASVPPALPHFPSSSPPNSPQSLTVYI